MDMLDVVAEVGGVIKDPCAGGALHMGTASPRQTGAGAGVTAGVCLLITVTIGVLINFHRLNHNWRGLFWGGGLARARDIRQGDGDVENGRLS